MVDSNVKSGIRRSAIGMVGSLCFGLYGVFVLVSIAMGGPASGGDAVAAALGVWLVIGCAETFKRRRVQWRYLRALATKST